MNPGLKGKNVLITGSGGTLGCAEALAFAEAGANILVHDMAEEPCRRTLEKLAPFGVKTCFYTCDITRPDEVKAMMDFMAQEMGSIDVLINNAGMNIMTVADGRLPFCEYHVPGWDRVVDVNINGTFFCSKYAARQMIRQKSGTIVNISSVEGFQGNRLQPAYVAAKAAMISLTKSMAEELGQYGVTVNSVAPGSTLNPSVSAKFYADKETSSRFLSNIPMGRPGVPADIANACVFFASDQGAYVTGQLLAVDGGWTCSYSREWPRN